MSSGRATVIARLEDAIRRYLEKSLIYMRKMGLYYDIGQSIESADGSVEHRLFKLLRFFGIVSERLETRIIEIIDNFILKFFGIVSERLETRIIEIANNFILKMLSLQSTLEDALSFSSLYANMLIILAFIFSVIVAWMQQPLP